MDAKELIDQGYQSTSNKFRTVARLPLGLSGLEALRQWHPDEYADLMARTERFAKSRYLRHHDTPKIELSDTEFREFKRSGGEVS